MKRIAIMHDLDEYMDEFKKKAPGWEIVMTEDEDAIRPLLADSEIVFGWSDDIEKICLLQPSALEWLHIYSAGVDFVPLDVIRDRGVMLTSSGGMNVPQLSETAIGLMIALVRAFRPTFANQVSSKWVRGFRHGVVRDFHLSQIHGKIVGILGVGKVGAEVARLAKAFEMKVIGITRTGGPRKYVDEAYGLDDLDKVFAESDFVVNILPATPASEKMIGARQFAAMKPSWYYVNVGRGSTTDTDALIAALEKEQLAGAALDVVDPEPLPEENPLWRMDNVIVMPHIGGMGPYNDERVAAIFSKNLEDYAAGRKPSLNLVDLKEYY